MINLNDMEKLDSVFRDAASNFELPFNEDSWVHMQQKLEEKKKKRFGLWWWCLSIGIIAFGLLIIILTQSSKK